jgi:hypothetical protein
MVGNGHEQANHRKVEFPPTIKQAILSSGESKSHQCLCHAWIPPLWRERDMLTDDKNGGKRSVILNLPCDECQNHHPVTAISEILNDRKCATAICSH